MQEAADNNVGIDRNAFIAEVLTDYSTAYESRQASLIGRKEVLTGKAKFGIFGDGKEIPQLAMARAFDLGDWRSGYYRDQTFMFAKKISNVKQFFAQLYADPNTNREPASGGRSMNGHFGTRFLDDSGNWLNQRETYNSSADISPTGGQMARALGIASASKIYRQNNLINTNNIFSDNGNEISFVTIGNASTSEGVFWETINAACVMQVPLLVSIWDDGYGISVPSKYQTTKENISEILKGFKTDKNGLGMEIFTVKAWDYANLCRIYKEAAEICRKHHTPVLVHVTEVTQPQGHSTSGSHERYKSKERLQWESDFDGIKKMREWILENQLASVQDLDLIEDNAKTNVKNQQKQAWIEFLSDIKIEINQFCEAANAIASKGICTAEITEITSGISAIAEPIRKDIANSIQKVLRLCRDFPQQDKQSLLDFKSEFYKLNENRYSSHIHSESENAVSKITSKPLILSEEEVDGYQIVRACFDAALERDPSVFAFGEDLGKIGDVNQGFSGLQDKHGELRVGDRGIREWTIIGEGLGAAMRGLRPIAEIQYLDYLLYALEIMSDDLATIQYRTKGGQKAPLIIRTRGHRLEGIWHSGSPMGMIINAVRGLHVCVPRNMTQAAGMYNTLLNCDEPALVIECLNGYRIKEKMPSNIGEFCVPFGIPEILNIGTDITLVTYGSCCRIAQDAINLLAEDGISVELIDVQTLLPFDIHESIAESVKKTNRLVVLDEDVPGGASAFILQQILEQQNIYYHLDSKPITITAKAHRPAYGTDGDYFSKPSVDEVYSKLYEIMHEVNPNKWKI